MTQRRSVFASVLAPACLAAIYLSLIPSLAPARSARPLNSQYTMALSLPSPTFQPGEPVVVTLILNNTSRSDRNVATPSHQTVLFNVLPRRAGSEAAQRLVEPVFSEREPADTHQALAPGASFQREFVFTRLSLERGDFVIQAVYTPRPAEGTTQPAEKVYAVPVPFSVKGQKVLVHRYVNGLMTREDAIRLAAAKAGKGGKGEAILITDEKGFSKWWVNIAAADGKGPLRAWFVDPYRAYVWRESKPFTAADRPAQTTLSKDSKALQHIRDKSANGKRTPRQ